MRQVYIFRKKFYFLYLRELVYAQPIVDLRVIYVIACDFLEVEKNARTRVLNKFRSLAEYITF